MEWSIQVLLKGENNSKQLDEIQATAKYHFGVLTLQVPIVTNVNFLLTISIQCQDIRLWELIKWSQGGGNALIFYQILSSYSGRKSGVISVENLYVDIRA